MIGQNDEQRFSDMYNTSGSKIKTVNISQKRIHISNFKSENSIWYAEFSSNDTKIWELKAFHCQNYSNLNLDDKYSNSNILSTFLVINQVIPLRTTQISINYNSKVSSGTGNITIYQSIDGKLLLRQHTSPTIPDTSDGSTNISINVFHSTFNRPGQSYSVVVGTNFVRCLKNNELLIGIGPTIWRFTTANGTIEFKKVYSDHGFSIMQGLSNQIADIMNKISRCLSTRSTYQPFPNTPTDISHWQIRTRYPKYH
ncbi:hypothetical protein G9A89_006315 [Geosiphon pyriformis]|nr:hypothetical protein G9A89_006315 [Geosiphon pyriformis]